jgi:hypothetical protein
MSKHKLIDRKMIVAAIFGMAFFVMMIVPAFIGGEEPGAGVKISKAQHMAHPPIDIPALTNTINPPAGFTLPIQYGQVGPNLIQAGVIDAASFRRYFQQNGVSLPDQEMEWLIRGGQEPIIINSRNASFLLTLFWGIGVSNQNPVLNQTSIQNANSWTLGQKSGEDLFSKKSFFTLSAEQQSRLEKIAQTAYQPCSEAPVLAPDNKYSLAALGLLEWMASQNTSPDIMLTALKQVNAFWFPEQTLEQGLFFVATQLKDYATIDPKTLASRAYFSATGFGQVHQWLKENGMTLDDSDSAVQCS